MPVSCAFSTQRPSDAELLAMPPPLNDGPGDPRRRLRRILVATDGTSQSDGALTVAGLLARRDGAAVDVLSVLPRWGPSAPVHEFLDMTGDLLADRLARVMEQSERALGGSPTPWNVRIVDSNRTVSSIVADAELEGHDLIVTGLPRGLIDRLLRRPTALAVALRAPTTVLAVPQHVTVLPTRAVVGVVEMEPATSIVPRAVTVLGDPATVRLVRIGASKEANEPGAWGGDPARRIVAHARAAGADLIAVGTQDARSIRERVCGGVSRRVLRSAHCCVLLRGPHDSLQAA